MRTIRIFISSPGDVDRERQRVVGIAERLNGEFGAIARFETIRWETQFYSAHDGFQPQIPEAADCDLVVAIFSTRLGSELPEDFPKRLPNGEPYPSGTAYELLTAVEARKKREFPDVYVFRKTTKPVVAIDDDSEYLRAKKQWTQLNAFFERWFRTSEGHFRAAFHTFITTDEFADLIDALLREWLHKHVLQGEQQASWPININGSPFRGLDPFESQHAPIFFGRSRDVRRAVDRFIATAEKGTPFLLVVGASGVGKSSFVRAGLVPRLTAPGVVETVDAWRITTLRPAAGKTPVDALAASLLAVGGREGSEERSSAALPEITEGDSRSARELADLMHESTVGAVRAIENALDRIATRERQRGAFEREVRTALVIIVDQLEDLFAANVAGADRALFTNLIAALVATGHVWVVATLRVDLYERLLAEPALFALKSAGADYDLAPPGPTELAEIIREPAKAAGLVYDLSADSTETLDERLLRDAVNADILPLLQFTLQRLFDERQLIDGETRLTTAAYESFGGLDGAIDQAAENSLRRLPTEEIDRLPRLLRLLAGLMHGEDSIALGGPPSLTIRLVALNEFDGDAPMYRLVDALVAARILTTSNENGVSSVRLAHQRVLESWKRAQEIVQASADFYRVTSEIRSQFRLWQASGGQCSLFLPSGFHLFRAQMITRQFGNELDSKLRSFIAASQWRQRLVRLNIAMLLLPFAAVFVTVVWNGILSWVAVSESIQSGIETIFICAFSAAFFVLWPASLSVLLWHYHRHRLALARQRVGGAMPLALQSPWRLRALQLNAVMALFVSVTLIFISVFVVAENFAGVAETLAAQPGNWGKPIVGIALVTLLLTLPLGFVVWLAALAFIFVQRKPYPWNRTSSG